MQHKDDKPRPKPFQAKLRHGGRKNYLGTFATAEEAALAVARFLGPEGVAAALVPEPTPLTAAEAHAAADEEGLSLVRAENATGFKHVAVTNGTGSKPFQALLQHGGRKVATSRRRRRRRSPSPASSGQRASRRRSRQSPRQ